MLPTNIINLYVCPAVGSTSADTMADCSGTLSSLQNLKKDLSFTDQFFMEKPQEEEPGKTNVEAE
ncbi:hypothetical protein Tco_1536245, partial [Tanacetum coccineum]